MSEEKKNEIADEPKPGNKLPPNAFHLDVVMGPEGTYSLTPLMKARLKRSNDFESDIRRLYLVSFDHDGGDASVIRKIANKFYDNVLEITMNMVAEIGDPEEKVEFLATIVPIKLAAFGASIPEELSERFSAAIADRKRLIEYVVPTGPITLGPNGDESEYFRNRIPIEEGRQSNVVSRMFSEIPEERLKILFNGLLKSQKPFIAEISFEEFKSHFLKDVIAPSKKINWLESKTSLAYLLTKTNGQEFLIQGENYDAYAVHFTLKGHKITDSFRKSFTSSPPRRSEEIDSILKRIRK